MAEFGSVAWQEEKIRNISMKMAKGEKLTDEERTFVEIQLLSI